MQVEGRTPSAVLRTLLHERFHLFQNGLPGGLEDPQSRREFLSDELAGVGAQLIAERLGANPQEIWYEIPAYIASGQGEALGYTPTQALSIFRYYLDLAAAIRADGR